MGLPNLGYQFEPDYPLKWVYRQMDRMLDFGSRDEGSNPSRPTNYMVTMVLVVSTPGCGSGGSDSNSDSHTIDVKWEM